MPEIQRRLLLVAGHDLDLDVAQVADLAKLFEDDVAENAVGVSRSCASQSPVTDPSANSRLICRRAPPSVSMAMDWKPPQASALSLMRPERGPNGQYFLAGGGGSRRLRRRRHTRDLWALVVFHLRSARVSRPRRGRHPARVSRPRRGRHPALGAGLPTPPGYPTDRSPAFTTDSGFEGVRAC
jgi:hypothetical protein